MMLTEAELKSFEDACGKIRHNVRAKSDGTVMKGSKKRNKEPNYPLRKFQQGWQKQKYQEELNLTEQQQLERKRSEDSWLE